MNKLDPNKPHLRFVSYKTVTDANGIERKERTFVLVPMKAKSKTKLTKEQVRNKKAARVYVSTGISDKIPYDDTIEKNEEHWGKLKLGKQVIADYRAWKKKFDEETTETIELENGFKQKIKIKLEFKPKPSMKLSASERDTRMKEHKKVSEALRLVKKARVKAFRDNPKPYTYEGYTSTTKARKERQNAFWVKHNERIITLINKLRAKGKQDTYKIAGTERGEIEANGIYKTKYKPEITFTGTKRQAVAETFKIGNSVENDGARLVGKNMTMFTSKLAA